MAAAVPELEPPGDIAVFHGLSVSPNWELLPDAIRPSSDIAVFPTITAPASRNRATGAESKRDKEPE
nr:hypothetical protein [Arthrobacter agilis]